MAPAAIAELLATKSHLLMGIINVTPDSFSDGGRFVSADDAIETALDMIEQGADILDIGGESTRPGAAPVSAGQEADRVLPVIAGIRRGHPEIPMSIDTVKAQVARQALAVGATIVNDISAGTDPEMWASVAPTTADLVLMHMQGTPTTMQQAPQYADVVAEVRDFLAARFAAAQAAGIARERLVIDPGIGFGKTLAHNLALLSGLEALHALTVPVLIGVSRKALIGQLLGGRGVTERLEGSLALLGVAAHHGARIFRVHDVPESRRFLTIWAAASCNSAPSNIGAGP